MFKKLMQAQLKIMNGILNGASAENRELTEDEQTKYNAAKAEFERLKGQQAQADELAAMEAAAAAVIGPLPAAEPPAAEPHTPAPAAQASIVAGRNLENQKPFDSRAHFFQDVIRAKLGNSGSMERLENAGLTTETGSEGGVLCPTEYMSGLMAKADEQSQLYERTTRVNVSKNTIVIPGIDEVSRADGSRWGGIQFDWIREGQEGTYTYPKFRSVDVKLGKLMGMTSITEELQEDAQALDSWISTAFPAEMAFSKDLAIFSGDGNGKPLGFQSASDVLVSVTRTTADTVVYEDIVNMWARMPFARQQRAVWLVTPEVQTKLPLMNLSVGTGGSAVYLPAGGAADAPYQRLFGRPVIAIEQATELGAVGDISLVDLSDYLFFEKGSIRTDSSIHVFFNSDKRALRFIQRANGLPYTRKALASRAKAAFTTSPYVTLGLAA